MPPEGHTSVTLPDELVAELDRYAAGVGAGSRATALRMLLDDGRILSEDAVDEIVLEIAERVEPEQGYIDDDKIARAVASKIDYAQLANAVADEVEGRMR